MQQFGAGPTRNWHLSQVASDTVLRKIGGARRAHLAPPPGALIGTITSPGGRLPNEGAPNFMLDEADHKLSMRISPRSKRPTLERLRTLLLHRVSNTQKLVLRRGLRSEEVRGYYCEPCGRWFEKPLWPAIPERIYCGGTGWRPGDRGCGRAFRVEAVLYEEVLPGEDFLLQVRADDDENVRPDDEARDEEPAHVDRQLAPANA